MGCIEELINIPTLTEYFKYVERQGRLQEVLSEIIKQSKVEFNYSEGDDDDDESK